MTDAQRLILVRAKALLNDKRKPDRTPAQFPQFDESITGRWPRGTEWKN